MSCAELQVWVRTEADTAGSVAQALWTDRTVVRTWCMRGTLHLLTPEQLALCAAAYDPAVLTGAWFRAFEVTPAEMERLAEAVLTALDEGTPMTRKELGERARPLLGDRLANRLGGSSWGELLKPIARRGLVVNGPRRGQEATYVRTDRWIGPLPTIERRAARAELLRRYLAAYGPASRKDYGRWSGTRLASAITTAVADAADEVCEVSVDGGRLLALRADVDELQELSAAASSGFAGAGGDLPVRLLPGFDPFTLGHSDRSHLLGEDHRARVYRTAGWISPTILTDGAIAGTWMHQPEAGALAVRLAPFRPLTPQERSGVEAEAERLAARVALRLALYT